jgi:predicted O-methyltransferase YrrM
MLKVLEEIFEKKTIEVDATGERVALHSHTSKEQGLFIQKIFDDVLPKRTLEVGMAYGISSLFILEKHREHGSEAGAHLIIEPFPWGNTAAYNFQKAGLLGYASIVNKLSDEVLPELYARKEHIQFAFVDTTKLFDVVMQDFYFIDKILDINGVIIIDDCDTTGINLVARFINNLENYKLIGSVGKVNLSWKRTLFNKMINFFIKIVPFKHSVFPNFSFKSSEELGIDYRCLAFKKMSHDKRNWDAKQIL